MAELLDLTGYWPLFLLMIACGTLQYVGAALLLWGIGGLVVIAVSRHPLFGGTPAALRIKSGRASRCRSGRRQPRVRQRHG